MTDTLPAINRYPTLAQLYAGQNPPGHSTLAYRCVTYSSAYQQMLATLHTSRSLVNDRLTLSSALTFQTTSSLPVLRLNIDETNNWVVGLLQSWAIVLDVITFYQERIANEGFWRTATERRSILELARAIGYELRPALAASTYLAFTVRTINDAALCRVTVPAGTAVQSIPMSSQAAGNSMPQLFETSADFEARPDWNELTPARTPGAAWPDLRSNNNSLRVDGTQIKLKAGDTLLIVGETTDPSPWMLTTIITVEPDKAKGYTRIEFTRDVMHGTEDGSITQPSVYVLRQAAALRTYDQGGIYFTPASQPDWSPSSFGLPNVPVYSLLHTEAGQQFAGTDKGVFRSVDDGNTWDDRSAGLMHAKVYALTSGSDGRLYAGTDKGGLFVSADNGDSWRRLTAEPAPKGLRALFRLGKPQPAAFPKTMIRQLSTRTENGTEYLIAATDEGVFASDDYGNSWIDMQPDRSNSTTQPSVARTLVAASPRLGSLAGTDRGVFPIDLSGTFKLKPLAVVAAVITVLLLVLTLELWAIGGFGAADVPLKPVIALVALLVGIGLTALLWFRPWRPHIDPLRMPVQTLTVQADDTLFAGTTSGVYRWQADAKRWQAINDGLQQEVFSVEVDQQPDLLDEGLLPDDVRQSFSDHGLELSENVAVTVVARGERWTIEDKQTLTVYSLYVNAAGLHVDQPNDIRTLSIDTQGVIYAGTQDGHVYRSDDHGDHWTDFGRDLSLANVSALLIDPGSGLLAGGTSLGNEPDGQWQRLHVQQRTVNLNKAYDGLAVSDWFVLQRHDMAVLYKTADVATIAGRLGRKAGSYTQLQADRVDQLRSFDRHDTTVLLQPEKLAPYNDQPLMGSQLEFDGDVPDLDAGHVIVVSGQRLRIRLSNLSGDLHLMSVDGLQQRPVQDGDMLQVMTPPVSLDDAHQRWQLKNQADFIGEITLSAPQVELQSAEDKDETICEVGKVRLSSRGSTTTVLLQDPLQHMYDRATVTVYANVVLATHGQTVNNEILGSTDRASADPPFKLQSQPLTYLSAPNGRGFESTLSVQVNQVTWQEVPALYPHDGGERVYTVRQNDTGYSRLAFGNGRHGARLPSGLDHITATYRTGSGAAGNVPANSLKVLRTRPAGIQGVTNPLPASGGVEPEAHDTARARAPQQIRALQRLVSLKDYEDFAIAFAGISRAQARLVWDGRLRRLHLTVAGETCDPIDQSSTVMTNLTQAITESRVSYAQPVQIDSFEPLYFNVKAGLILDPDRAAEADRIVAAAAQKLGDVFAYGQIDLAQPVFASDIIAALQTVTGINAVLLDQLYVVGQAESFNTQLVAQSARMVNGKLLPAQLLIINTTGDAGIVLSVRPPVAALEPAS